MIRRTTVMAGTFALVVGPALLHAQAESRPRAATPPAAPAAKAAARPRIAIIPPSPPAAQPGFTKFGVGQGTVSSNLVNGSIAPAVSTPRIVQIYYLPTVVLSDGRVLANFGTGRGYEQVLKRCPSFTGTMPPNFAIAPCFTVDSYGRYSVMQQR